MSICCLIYNNQFTVLSLSPPCGGPFAAVSDAYKKYNTEKEVPDETHTVDGLALFQVQGSGPENMQAIQVETVSYVSHLPSTSSFSFY